MSFDFFMILELLASMLCGGIIGYLREIEGKSAGLRTHILVCLGSTLFMLLSLHAGSISSLADPARIAAGIVTGIGFLGAGAIIQSQGSVKGLTTAATIWVTCGVGMAVGAGLYMEGIITALLTVFVLKWLRDMETYILKSKNMEEDND